MKNVLIVVDTSQSSLWLAYYAMGLTRRIAARVSILLVIDPDYGDETGDADEWIGSPEKRLESILAEDHSGGRRVEFFVARGRMEEEIPKFISENDISKLFIGSPQSKRAEVYVRLMRTIDAVNTTTGCDVEVVQKVSAQK
ncbi:universal stress protein [Pseudodesulfovibrio sp.]|uniref:universal stress protein n=1 Tax=Pseudodesulfovibrio sp. TaxID=2035812 RepID=UPI002610A625|nr:universal stress protein [Pseudodesulfovibrio sp.]MDD3311427.1 universal stress protein [Pseudodesulfovibrio sp.]